MPEDTLPAVCGLFCGSCTYLGNRCGGRDNVKEKPFWTELIGIGTAPVYDRCVNTRHYGRCGECSELLCDNYHQVKTRVISDLQIKTIDIGKKKLRKRANN